VPALRSYVEGFSERSKIKVDSKLPGTSALSLDTETAIFRIVQESLTNIHRHSESSGSKHPASPHEDYVSVEIQDHGKGYRRRNSPVNAGVGIGECARGFGSSAAHSRYGRAAKYVVLAHSRRESSTHKADIDQGGASGSLPQQVDSTPVRCAEKKQGKQTISRFKLRHKGRDNHWTCQLAITAH